MEIIYLLIPISLILLGVIVWILLWAVRDGQYDDRIVDDNKPVIKGSRQKNSRRGGAG